MALKLNGKDDRLDAKDFRSFARTARLKATDADAIIDNTLAQVGRAIERISLPVLSAYGPNGRQLVEQMFEIIHSRVTSFA